MAACLVADVAYFTDSTEVFCSCILKCHTRPSHSRACRDNKATVSYLCCLMCQTREHKAPLTFLKLNYKAKISTKATGTEPRPWPCTVSDSEYVYKMYYII